MGLRIPSEVPRHLRESAFPVGSPGADPAWSANDALEVVDSLTGTKIAILEIDVYASAPGGLVPSDDGWSCERIGAETATEFAERSREAAAAFIRGRENEGEHAGELYCIEFSGQQEAA